MSLRTRALVVAGLALAAACIGMPGFSGATYTLSTGSTGTVRAASDWTPPTVAVNSAGATLSGTTLITASASDANSGISSVQLQYAAAGTSTWTNLCAARTVAPYSCSWDTTASTDGDYQLRATATDNAGYSTTSSALAVAVLNTATVTLADPGDNLRGSVPISATLAGYGNQTVTALRLEYSVADANSWTAVCSTTTASVGCTWNTAALTGSYDLRAYGAVGGKTYTSTASGLTVDNKAPTGGVTSPITLATIGGTVSLVTNAADADAGVDTAVVQYAPTGTTTWATACTAGTAPYSCRFDTTTITDRGYDLRTIVTDLAGNTSTSATVVGVVVSNALPTVSIEQPTAAAFVSGTVGVTANANSSAGITRVSIQARTGTGTFAEVCSATTSPYTCSWNTAGLNGSYDLRAVLTDKLARTVTSSTVTVTVDNSPLKAYDVQTANSGTAGRLNAGDRIVLTYTSAVNPATILTGWNGAATTVAARTVDGLSLGRTSTDDTFSVDGTNLGTVNLRGNFVRKNKTLTITGSTMTASTTTVNGATATVVTITLGTPVGSAATASTLGAMVWTPLSAVRTTTGVACSTAPATESGTADKDF
jgi:hypothetical protein